MHKGDKGYEQHAANVLEKKQAINAAGPSIHNEAALDKRPMEWLQEADTVLVKSVSHLSAAMVQELTDAEITSIHDFVDKAIKALKVFKDNARERVMAAIVLRGKPVTNRGTLEIELGNGRVQRAIPDDTGYDVDMVEKLLRAKNLDVNIYLDKKPIKYVVNEMRLMQMVAEGLLTSEELKQCKSPIVYKIGRTQAAKDEQKVTFLPDGEE